MITALADEAELLKPKRCFGKSSFQRKHRAPITRAHHSGTHSLTLLIMNLSSVPSLRNYGSGAAWASAFAVLSMARSRRRTLTGRFYPCVSVSRGSPYQFVAHWLSVLPQALPRVSWRPGGTWYSFHHLFLYPSIYHWSILYYFIHLYYLFIYLLLFLVIYLHLSVYFFYILLLLFVVIYLHLSVYIFYILLLLFVIYLHLFVYSFICYFTYLFI